MVSKHQLSNILFLDIETVRGVRNYNDLDIRMKSLWNKKMQWHIDKENTTPDELYEKAAIWAEFGKIVCISVGYITKTKTKNNPTLRVKSFYGHNEKELLNNFAELLNNYYYKSQHLLCAHNGKEFDYPYISRRMLINGIKLPEILNISGKKPWEIKHIDTLDMWKFGDYKHYTSLDLLAALFNIPSPKDDIDGSMVSKVYWEDNDIEKIAEYCQKDVITTCKLYLKMVQYDINGELQLDII